MYIGLYECNEKIGSIVSGKPKVSIKQRHTNDFYEYIMQTGVPSGSIRAFIDAVTTSCDVIENY